MLFNSLRQLVIEPTQATLVDVSPRDGLQNEPVRFLAEERARWIEALLSAGVPEVEAGSFVHPGRVPQMARTEEVLRALPWAAERLWTLVPNRTGLERALRAGARNVVVLLSATEAHSRANLGRPVSAALGELEEVVAAAREASLRVRLAVSMAWVDPSEGVVPPERVVDLCRRARDLGIPELTLCDTYGGASPGAVADLLERVSKLYPLESVGVHLHDTFGVAAANALVALLAGVRRFDASLGGLGGCPFAPGARGNVATEDLDYLFASLGVRTGVDRNRLLAARDASLELLKIRKTAP